MRFLDKPKENVKFEVDKRRTNILPITQSGT